MLMAHTRQSHALATSELPLIPTPFPPPFIVVQTLSKSFKLVPIMLMGKLLTNKNYPLYEYAVAASIGLGNTLFMVRRTLT